MVSAPSNARISMRSTSLTSRLAPPNAASFVRVPLAEMPNRVTDVRPDLAEGVEVGLAFDDVAAVAETPDEQVVAGAQQGDVVARAAGDRVIAIVAGQLVVAGAAVDDIVAVAGNSASSPAAPLRTSLSSPPNSTSAPAPPMTVSLPTPPSSATGAAPASSFEPSMDVVPAQGVEGDAILVRLGPGNSHLIRQPGDEDRAERY